MRAAVNGVNQQKELEGPAAEELARTFEKHTVKLAATVKLQADNRKSLPPQLPTPLFEPNLQLFPNSNSNKQKMAACEHLKRLKLTKSGNSEENKEKRRSSNVMKRS